MDTLSWFFPFFSTRNATTMMPIEIDEIARHMRHTREPQAREMRTELVPNLHLNWSAIIFRIPCHSAATTSTLITTWTTSAANL